MRTEELAKSRPLYLAVLDRQIIARQQKLVHSLDDRCHVVVRVFDDEPRMRFRAQQLRVKQTLGIEAVPPIKADAGCSISAFFRSTEWTRPSMPQSAKLSANHTALPPKPEPISNTFAGAARKLAPDTWRNRTRSLGAACPASASASARPATSVIRRPRTRCHSGGDNDRRLLPLGEIDKPALLPAVKK